MLERTTSRLRFSHRRIPRAGAVDQSSVPLPSRRGESGSQRADGPVRWVRIHRRAHGSRRTLLHATPTQMDIYVAILSFFCFTKPAFGFGSDQDYQIDIINELDSANATYGITQVAGLHNASKAFIFRATGGVLGSVRTQEEDVPRGLRLFVPNWG
ncbi:Protein kinase C-binding protein NELL1 [Oryzias melastigma]|uniref:Protein kinase C-binding protein NELL1 n=1 Tax=Oryzias melastigma TaxID=30732 RepID=A0A834F2N9_ORYME|nr:Protein kinase C-binding protein NELL1 [Oryzias melastigma]